jgi:hypothetical protein
VIFLLYFFVITPVFVLLRCVDSPIKKRLTLSTSFYEEIPFLPLRPEREKRTVPGKSVDEGVRRKSGEVCYEKITGVSVI